MAGQIHYEIFSRKTPQSGWVLQNALEDRDAAIAQARELLNARRAAAIKVTKEVFSDDTGEFRTYTVLTEGLPETRSKPKAASSAEPVCTSPQDLYSRHARETIARVLEDWLRRQGATAFELLHSPLLCQRLDASVNDLTHAIQKVAIPESEETGASIHEIMRRWNNLVDKAIARVINDGRKNVFSEIDLTGDIATQVARIGQSPERHYVLGGAVARLMGADRSTEGKLAPLTQIATALAARSDLQWALDIIETPLVELLGRRGGLNDSQDAKSDSLAFMTHMVSSEAIERLSQVDASIGRALPPPPPHLEAFAHLIRKGHFRNLRLQAFRNVLTELRGVKRLMPDNPVGEIDLLRAMALALTAGSQQQVEREDISDAFIERSKMLVSSAFVEGLTRGAPHCLEEIERLLWLCENVVGAANKKQAARWLLSSLTAHRFETDLRDPKRPAAQRLQLLALLQRRITKASLSESDTEAAHTRLGQIGAQIAGDVQLLPQILKGSKSPLQRMAALLGLATGQSGPLGALSELAKAEIMKQLRAPDVRASLMEDPAALVRLKPLLVQAGLAA
ncbi:hypothetical protein [Asticcacaulis excentricus]|uniref:cAMP-binding proteins n=1 Tax=Asticcacaulis excentricus TaxID=78587 RepID=A0A3G9G977_9CAUL|nr:hypothetical protein [Asticcacaulis excentricus]BBF80898.1 cAMP-binding proteins [Asticcacaulis excentricus]